MKFYRIVWNDKRANKYHPVSRTNVVRAANEKDAQSALRKNFGSEKYVEIVTVDEFTPEE